MNFGRLRMGYNMEPEASLNEGVRLGLQDRVFGWLVEPRLPAWLRPNHITLIRLLLVPLVLLPLALDAYSVALPVFILFGLTDTFDGSLARTRRQISQWGIVFDAVADKIFIVSVVVAILVKAGGWWLGAALLAAEGTVITAALIRRWRGEVRPANWWGKIKMVCEVVGISALFLQQWWGREVLLHWPQACLSVAVACGFVSAVWTSSKRIKL
jgi:phosphatidylglycerophosphate synthase